MRYAGRLKILLGAGVIALIAVSFGYLLQNPGRKPAPAPVKGADVEQAEVVIDGFNFSKTEEDDSAWELNARKAEVRKDTGIAKLEDLDASFRSGGGMVLNLKAEQGVFDTGTKRMELSGGESDIIVTSSNGYEMTLRDVSWDNDERKLSTSSRVTIDGGNISIEGNGMEASADMQEVRIVDGVKTVFRPAR